MLPIEHSESLVMSSREIADLCGKMHKHVIRDIRKQLGEDASKFGRVYIAGNNEKRPCYELPFRECMVIVTGYNVELRAKVIDRWMELEKKPNSTPSPVGFTIEDIVKAVEGAVDAAVDARMGKYAAKRKDPSESTKRRLIEVFHKRGSRCPCCEQAKHEDDLNIDHWYANSSAEVAALWPICVDCHKDIKMDAEYRHKLKARFDAFHEFRKTLSGEQLRLI